MSNLALQAHLRTISGRQVGQLRRTGNVPGVMYGNGVDSISITLNARDMAAMWKTAGSSQLVDLKIGDNAPIKVLIQDLQIHPVLDTIVHADFYQVRMSEKLETEIPLKFIGISPAVAELEGNLITEKDALEIRCLPGDLVPEFEVDLSVLKTFDDVIKVGDVKVPSTIEVLNDPEETIVLVTAPRSEEELEADLAEPVTEEGIEAIKTEGEVEAEEKAAEEAEEPAEQV